MWMKVTWKGNGAERLRETALGSLISCYVKSESSHGDRVCYKPRRAVLPDLGGPHQGSIYLGNGE